MPQLMPMMWIMSMFMVGFILMIMINLFFYINKDKLYMNVYEKNMNYSVYLW